MQCFFVPVHEIRISRVVIYMAEQQWTKCTF
jgi:hypothetical protein